MSRRRFWWCVFLVAQAPLVYGVQTLVLANSDRPVVAALVFVTVQLVVSACVGQAAGQGWKHPLPYLVPVGAALMLLPPGAGWLPTVVAGAVFYLDLAAVAWVWKAR